MEAWLHAYLASDRGKINGATDGAQEWEFYSWRDHAVIARIIPDLKAFVWFGLLL